MARVPSSFALQEGFAGSMVNFTVDQVRALMDFPDQVRNMSVIAHVGHGKSTVCDLIVAAAGIIKLEHTGPIRLLDTRDAEAKARCTITSTAVSMHYRVAKEIIEKLDDDKRGFLINLIDSPGHVDFSSEVAAALRVTDGALVVVDCVEGACVQTETVLRQALTERIRPVLFLNKTDRLIIELQQDPEEVYGGFEKTIQKVNIIISTYNDTVMGDLGVDPVKGTVVIGSGFQGWAFSVTQFARLYASKFGVDEGKMADRLWGDNFFDAANKKWIKEDTNEQGVRLKRAFCEFCLQPIYQVVDCAMNEKEDKLEEILTKLKITLTTEEKEKVPKKKLKAIMTKFLPAADTLLQMMVAHLPSPRTAQKYRAELLYTGPSGDKYFQGIQNCDQNAPLMLYISKMLPTLERGRFFAFGRIFAGTVKGGQKCRIMGGNYVKGKRTDLFEEKPIQRCVLMMGRYLEAVEDMPCGNIVGLVGVDKFILKTATITEDGEDPYPLKGMKYSVSHVVRVAVEAKNVHDLPKLVEGLRRLARCDPMVECTVHEGGEHLVAGPSELYLEICLRDLSEDFMNGAPIKISEPIVSFRETVTAHSSIQCMSRSPNQHNRLFCKGAPLGEALSLDIEDGKAGVNEDPKYRARFLAEKYNWDVAEGRKIWSFSPDGKGPNLLVDVTKGLQNMVELKSSFIAAWQWATKEGAMCDEPMRGFRVNIEDVTMHADAIHRGAGQIIPTARRVFYACELTASPKLMEPVFHVDIQTVEPVLGVVHEVLTRRRGTIISEENRPGTCIYNVHAYLPIAESFGFEADLHAATGGNAFAQSVFDHWQLYPGDPLEPKSQANETVLKIRVRKALKPDIPTLDSFMDKL